MTEKYEAPLLEHEADGIKELDNKLPRWWVWLFYLAVVYGIFYMNYYHITGKGKSARAQYHEEMALARAAQEEAAASAAATPRDVAPSNDPVVLAQGAAVYQVNCVACHTADGGGLIGPNFTDDYFIHGPTFLDMVVTIEHGVPAKGMVAWKPLLKPAELMAVASHVWNLRGTTPANPKAPEGNLGGEFEGVDRQPGQSLASLSEPAPAATTEPGPVDAGAEVAAAGETASEPSLDEATLAAGKAVYTKNCLVCHTADGGGLVGPNFCDDYFIHGPAFADSIKVINEGVPAKGMITWKPILKPGEIHAVASYIWTFRGTTPANPKAPEGTQHK